jgi:hypothetical protein
MSSTCTNSTCISALRSPSTVAQDIDTSPWAPALQLRTPSTRPLRAASAVAQAIDTLDPC